MTEIFRHIKSSRNSEWNVNREMEKTFQIFLLFIPYPGVINKKTKNCCKEPKRLEKKKKRTVKISRKGSKSFVESAPTPRRRIHEKWELFKLSRAFDYGDVFSCFIHYILRCTIDVPKKRLRVFIVSTKLFTSLPRHVILFENEKNYFSRSNE